MGIIENILQNFWWLLVLIGVMIVIHELGHYLVARLFDVHIQAFSIGFGPKLFSRQFGETEFRICWLPIGGYVKMAGEQPNDAPTRADSTSSRAGSASDRGRRAGHECSAGLRPGRPGCSCCTIPSSPAPPRLPPWAMSNPDRPPIKAGVHEGDLIIQIENKTDPTWEDVAMREVVSARRWVPLLVRRGNQVLHLDVMPVSDPSSGLGSAGWMPQTDVEVGGFIPGMDAERKGLRKGDQFISHQRRADSRGSEGA